MKSIVTALVISLAMIAIGCAPSISVKQDYDKDANFTALKTYDWMHAPTTAVGNVKAALERNTLLDKRVRSNVNDQLMAKGYRQDSANPDFYVIYHTGVEDKVNVTDWGYSYAGYGRYSGWGAPSSIDVYQYKEGTLIVDVIDAKTKQLIWRGFATGTVNPDAKTEQREKKLNEAITKMMSQFPPK
ncbi:MAG: DUF4136 domain-containing protein [bacterium]